MQERIMFDYVQIKWDILSNYGPTLLLFHFFLHFGLTKYETTSNLSH